MKENFFPHLLRASCALALHFVVLLILPLSSFSQSNTFVDTDGSAGLFSFKEWTNMNDVDTIDVKLNTCEASIIQLRNFVNQNVSIANGPNLPFRYFIAKAPIGFNPLEIESSLGTITVNQTDNSTTTKGLYIIGCESNLSVADITGSSLFPAVVYFPVRVTSLARFTNGLADTSYVCPGPGYTYLLASAGGVRYDWYSITDANRNFITYTRNSQGMPTAIPGEFGVKITNAEGCVKEEKTLALLTPSQLEMLEDNIVLCSNQSITLSTGYEVKNPLWVKPSGEVVRGVNYIASEPGRYISQGISELGGCVLRDTTVITLSSQLPPVLPNIPEEIHYCPNTADFRAFDLVTGTEVSILNGVVQGVVPPNTSFFWQRNGVEISRNRTIFLQPDELSGTISLRMINQYGCESHLETRLYKDLPAPDLTKIRDTFVCVSNQAINLVAPSGQSTYLWQRINRNGSTTNLSTNSSFTAPVGNYRLSVSDAQCQSKQDFRVVGIIPTPSLSSVAPVCAGTPVVVNNNISNSDSINYAFLWRKGDIIVSASKQLSISNIQAATAGDYLHTIRHKTTGCNVELTSNIRLTTPAAVIPVNLSGGGDKCEGARVILDNAINQFDQNLYTYAWSKNGQQLSSSKSLVINNFQSTNGGLYTHSIRHSQSGCILDQTVNVIFNSNPAIPIVSSNSVNGRVCAGQTITYSTGAFNNYSWFKDGVAIANAKSQSLVATSPGNYSVIVGTDKGCTSRSAESAFVTIPLPGMPALNSSYTICKEFDNVNNRTVLISSLSELPFNDSGLRWYKNNVRQTSLASGTYQVTRVNAEGCEGSARTVNIQIDKPYVCETYNPYVASRSVSCGQTLRIEAEDYDDGNLFDKEATNRGNVFTRGTNGGVDLQSTEDIGGGANVGWIYTGEFLTYSFNAQTSGNYTLGLRLSARNSGRILYLKIDGVFVQSVAINRTGGNQNWITQYLSNLFFLAGRHVITIGFSNANGDVNFNYLELTAPSSCSQKSDLLEEADVVAEPKFTNTNGQIKVYPNPVFNGFATFSTSDFNLSGEEAAQLQIFSSVGSLVYECQIDSNERELDLSNLTSGVYFARATNGNQVAQTKFIISK